MDENINKRLLSVDLVRGLAIIGVLFIHSTIYGIWQTETNALNIVPFGVVIGFLPIILMGTWGGGFPLISSLVSTFLIYSRMEKGYSFKQTSIPVIINSTILLLLDPLRSLLFGRTWTNSFSEGYNYSVLTRLLDLGQLGLPSAEKLMQIGSLPAIGLSGYMTVALLWLLFHNKGRKKTIRNVSILLALGLILVGSSNFINEALFPVSKNLFIKGGVNIFLAYLLRLFVGAQLSFFPMGLYGIFGMIPGYLYAQKKEFKWIKVYGLSLGTLFLSGFGLTLGLTLSHASSIEAGLFGILDYEIYPRELLFFSLGCMMLLLVPLAKKFDYANYYKKVILTKNTTFIRRFGVATLSIYFFESFFDNIFAKIFHALFGDPTVFNAPDEFMSNFPAILLYEFTIFSFWGLVIYFWSKHNYKFGLEHAIITLSKPLRKVKSRRAYLYVPSDEMVEEAKAALKNNEEQKEKQK